MSRHQIKVREAGQELMVQGAIYKPATLIVQEAAIMQPATTTRTGIYSPAGNYMVQGEAYRFG